MVFGPNPLALAGLVAAVYLGPAEAVSLDGTEIHKPTSTATLTVEGTAININIYVNKGEPATVDVPVTVPVAPVKAQAPKPPPPTPKPTAEPTAEPTAKPQSELDAVKAMNEEKPTAGPFPDGSWPVYYDVNSKPTKHKKQHQVTHTTTVNGHIKVNQHQHVDPFPTESWPIYYNTASMTYRWQAEEPHCICGVDSVLRPVKCVDVKGAAAKADKCDASTMPARIVQCPKCDAAAEDPASHAATRPAQEAQAAATPTAEPTAEPTTEPTAEPTTEPSAAPTEGEGHKIETRLSHSKSLGTPNLQEKVEMDDMDIDVSFIDAVYDSAEDLSVFKYSLSTESSSEAVMSWTLALSKCVDVDVESSQLGDGLVFDEMAQLFGLGWNDGVEAATQKAFNLYVHGRSAVGEVMYAVVTENQFAMSTIHGPVCDGGAIEEASGVGDYEWKAGKFPSCNCEKPQVSRPVYCVSAATGQEVDKQKCIMLGVAAPPAYWKCSACVGTGHMSAAAGRTSDPAVQVETVQPLSPENPETPVETPETPSEPDQPPQYSPDNEADLIREMNEAVLDSELLPGGAGTHREVTTEDIGIDVKFVDASFKPEEGLTEFTYSVTIGEQAEDLTSWTLGLAQCVEVVGEIANVGEHHVTDPASQLYGISWTDKMGTAKNKDFTLQVQGQVNTDTVAYAVVTAKAFAFGEIQGPVCRSGGLLPNGREMLDRTSEELVAPAVHRRMQPDLEQQPGVRRRLLPRS